MTNSPKIFYMYSSLCHHSDHNTDECNFQFEFEIMSFIYLIDVNIMAKISADNSTRKSFIC